MILKRTLLIAVMAIFSLSFTNAQVILSGTGDGGFETGTTFPLNGWTAVNDGTNKWWCGTVYHPVGARGAHISQQATGTNNNYNKNNIQVSHLYRSIVIPANASNIQLTFKWKCAGESGYDFIRVTLAPSGTVPVANVELPTTNMIFDDLADDDGTTTYTETYTIPNSYAGTTRTLIFSWINDDLFGTNPAGAIDDVNVTFTPLPGCTSTPNTGTITATGNITNFCGSATTTLTLGGASTGTGISYNWQYYNGTTWQPTGTNATTLAITNLATTTQYRVITTCSNSGLSATAAAVTITVNPNPTLTVSPSESFVCSSTQSVTLTASGTGTSYSWSPGTGLNTTTGTTVIATPGTSGKAYTVTSVLGPCSVSAMASVNVATPAAITATATPATICSGASTQLAATQLTNGNYQVYPIAPYTLTPSSPTVAFSNTVAPFDGDYDDGRSAAIPLPFAFSYFGAAVTQILLGTNGFAAFANPNAIADALVAQNLPDGTTPNSVIALFWHDLTFADNGSCSYGTYGTAPNRKFVISYTGVPSYDDDFANNTGQIILHETTNYIDVIVQHSGYGGEDKTLGIESSGTGIVGITPPGRNAASWTVTTTPEAYRFAVTDYTYAWTPATNLSSTTVYNPSATNITAPVTYSVNVSNSITGCTSTAAAAVAVNPLPTASISTGTAPVCAGATSAVTFTGTPGATVSYNINGGTTQTVLLDAGGSYVLTTAPLTSTTTVNLVGVTSTQNCPGTATGSATITVNPRPTMNLAGTQTICAGATGYIQFNPLVGTQPWTVTYEDNYGNQFTETMNSSTQVAINPNVSTTYTITGLQDANCTSIAGDWSGTAVVTVNPRPTASLSTSAPAVCDGASVDLIVTMTGTAPFNFEIFDGNVPTTYTNITTNPYIISVNPTVATTYNVNYIQDANNCFSQSTDVGVPVTLNHYTRPTASISGDNTICNGGQSTITLNLTGTGPWEVEYYDGNGNTTLTGITSSPYTFNVTPSASTTYTLATVSDAYCTAIGSGMTGSADITVNQPPAITTPPTDQSRCQGDVAVFTALASGTGISYQWLEDGLPLSDNTIYSGTGTQTLTISNLAGLDGKSYQVVATGTCSPAATSTAAILSVNTINNWTGAVSTLWSDVNNWGCGILPNEFTDVVITAPVPNMPEIDIPTAICNHLSVNAGTSVTFTGTGNVLEVKSDINGAGSFDGSLGKVILSGSSTQTVPGVTYGSLEVDGGSTKSFSGNATVTGNLDLVDGYVVLGANNLTLGQNATVTNSSAQSFVVTNSTGVVISENMGATGNTAAVLFPVGSDASAYTPVTITNAGDMDNINVRVITGVYDTYNGETPNGTLQIANAVDKTWFINEAVAGGSDATVTVQWNVTDELAAFNNTNCQVSHYNTTTNEWESGPMSAAAGTGPFTQTRTGVQSFSPFGVGSEGSPLPIDLVSFTGELFNDDARLTWVTVNEFNMQNYVLERSVDMGKSFSSVAILPVEGNNKVGKTTYRHTDEKVRALKAEKIFYRLKMREVSGKYKYSNVVSIHVDSKIARGMIDAYPNPVSGSTLFVRMPAETNQAISLIVTDMAGKTLNTVHYKAGEYAADAVPVSINGLAQGMYMLRVVDEQNNTIDVLKFDRK